MGRVMPLNVIDPRLPSKTIENGGRAPSGWPRVMVKPDPHPPDTALSSSDVSSLISLLLCD